MTLDSLLLEMADRDVLARFPATEYRQLQASSYNRASVSRGKPGWFADSDGVSCIREETIGGRTEWVILEHEGPGALTKLWTPFFYYSFDDRVGPRIRIYLDGFESPVVDERFIELLTRNEWPDSYGARPPRRNSFQVPSPFAGFTARAGNLYLPIPFARACKVTLTGKAFYNIVDYRAYPQGTRVETFTMDRYRAAEGRLAEVGRELESPAPTEAGTTYQREGEVIAADPLALDLAPGPGAIRRLEVRLVADRVRARPSVLRSTILRILVDGEETVWCPLGDFFGSPNAIHSFHTWTRTVSAEGAMVCRWVMPYREAARIELENVGGDALRARLTVIAASWRWDDRSMHFHAVWRPDDVLPGHVFRDWNFVDIRGKGVLVGDAWTVLNPTDGWWGEGDEKIYVDGAYERGFPDHFGTGTEDYYGWAGGVNPTRADEFSHPYLANIAVGSTPTGTTRGFNISTRIRALDAIPFHRRLVFDMEASPGVDQRNPWDLLGYSAVAFFYAFPGATCNRPPSPREAARPAVTLEDLRRGSDDIRSTIEVGEGVEVLGSSGRYGSANIGWVRFADHVWLVGTPHPDLVSRALAAVTARAALPVRGAILTQAGPGEVESVRALARERLPVVASCEAAGALRAAGVEAEIREFADRLEMADGAARLEVTGLGGEKGAGAAVVLVHGPQVLFTGDLCVNGPRAVVAGADTTRWIEVLERLEALPVKVVVPGRGSVGGPEALARQRRYLRELRRQVALGVARGLPAAEVTASVRIGPEWLAWWPYDSPTADDIGQLYREMTFPEAPLGIHPLAAMKSRPRVLALVGDNVHDPDTIQTGLAPAFEKAEVEARFLFDPRGLSAESLRHFDLLVILRDGTWYPKGTDQPYEMWMAPEVERAIVRFVEAGGGLLALHNSTGVYPPGGPYLKLLGGTYHGHGPLERFRVRVVDPGHPITRGVPEYEVADEQHTPIPDTGVVHLLLESRSDDGVVGHAGWAREAGRGRVCYLANGHTREALLHPAFQTLLRNAVGWCVKRER